MISCGSSGGEPTKLTLDDYVNNKAFQVKDSEIKNGVIKSNAKPLFSEAPTQAKAILEKLHNEGRAYKADNVLLAGPLQYFQSLEADGSLSTWYPVLVDNINEIKMPWYNKPGFTLYVLDSFLTPETDLQISGLLKGQKDKYGKIVSEDQLYLSMKDEPTPSYSPFIEWESGGIKVSSPYPSDNHNFWPTMQSKKIPTVQFEEGESEVSGLQAYIAISPEGGIASVLLSGSSDLKNSQSKYYWESNVQKLNFPTTLSTTGRFEVKLDEDVFHTPRLEVRGRVIVDATSVYAYRKP